MLKKLLIIIIGILVGFVFGLYIIFYTSILPLGNKNASKSLINPIAGQKKVIGFLPYWLLDKANTDYSKYITTLTYFGVRVGPDGKIQKLLTPQEEEPGWYALSSGKLDPFFNDALKNKISLSLLASSGNNDSIEALVQNPIQNARNFVTDVNPLIQKYKFSDINLDIEYTSQASAAARLGFTQFVSQVRKDLNKSISLTVEITTTDVIKNHLIDPKAMGQIANNVVLMAYDYHSPSSFVTGPVAPLNGAGIMSEYDVLSAVENALAIIPAQKLVLGIPLYGYEWETLLPYPRAAVIPNTGVTASSDRVESLLVTCASCSATLDTYAQENYISFYDQASNDYHLIFFPDKNSTLAKLNLAGSFELKGVALWALGYEGKNIMEPLASFK